MPDLAPFAVTEFNSRGRAVPELPSRSRGEFARDRDRIIHSTAFRRLEYKTQVFINHEGDLFRTRLTHSIEVAQIARSIARALNVNDDLTEAVALAHDLGHTPFGHTGQDALNDCMNDRGGFEHNLQSLRIVDRLEERYGAFDGLNLMFETREGIVKHCPRQMIADLGDLGERFRLGLRPTLEAQICDLADEIAYNNHDIDDGLRSGLLEIGDLRSVALFARCMDEATSEFPGLSERRVVHETIRRTIGAQVGDLLAESKQLIERATPETVDEIRHAPPLIAFSEAMTRENAELKRFLFRNLYRHSRVLAMNEAAASVVRALFESYMAEPSNMPFQYQERAGEERARTVADYIAGMTDRYAIREYQRLYGAASADTGVLWAHAGYGY